MKRLSLVLSVMCFVVVLILDSEAQAAWKDISVPYVHQVMSFEKAIYDGHNGCCPVSAYMVLVHHKLLQEMCPRYQVYSVYADLRGNTYSKEAYDWNGVDSKIGGSSVFSHKNIKGMHGSIVTQHFEKDGSEWWGANLSKLEEFLESNGLQYKTSWGNYCILMPQIKMMIDAGLPIIGHADIYPGAWGHYLVIRGYNEPYNVYVNDPFGDAQSTWNGKTWGECMQYDISRTSGKRAVFDRITIAYPIGLFPAHTQFLWSDSVSHTAWQSGKERISYPVRL